MAEGATKSARKPDPKRRRAARLAAVQALYEMELGGAGSERVTADFLARGGTAQLDGKALAADPAFMTDLVRGFAARRADTDALVAAALDKGRTPGRLEAVLRAILRCGAFELLARADVDPPVVISEYVAIAGGFFDGPEPTLVNAVLDRVAHAVRADDLADRAR